MSFIRAKEIPPHSGNWYDYEVETIHEDGKVMQKVIQYIGKSGTVTNPHLIGSMRRSNSITDSVIPFNRANPSNTITPLQPLVTCKHCQSQKIVKFGTQKGTQYYWCKDCHHKFVNNGAIPRMKISADKIASAIGRRIHRCNKKISISLMSKWLMTLVGNFI